MSSVSPTYTPGAVVNGWYMASDYNWYPVPVPQQPATVVVNDNRGVTSALWIIIAILLFPVWVWFTPLLVVAGVVWLAVALVQAAYNAFGLVGIAVVCGAYLVAALALLAWLGRLA